MWKYILFIIFCSISLFSDGSLDLKNIKDGETIEVNSGIYYWKDHLLFEVLSQTNLGNDCHFILPKEGHCPNLIPDWNQIEKLLSNNEFRNLPQVQLPHSWELDNRQVSLGTSTYFLPVDGGNLDFTIFSRYGLGNTSSRVWIYDHGKLILLFNNGVTSNKTFLHLPNWLRFYIDKIKLSSSIIVIEISNFELMQGKLNKFEIQKYKSNNLFKFHTYEYLDIIILSILFTTSLYHLLLFFQIRRLMYTFLFGIFCLSIFFRALSTSNFIWEYIETKEMFYITYRSMWATFIISYLLFYFYFIQILNFKKFIIGKLLLVILGISSTIFILFIKTEFIDKFSLEILFGIVFSIILETWILIYCMLGLNGRESQILSRKLLLIFLVLLITVINDMLPLFGIYFSKTLLVPLGTVLFVLGQSWIISEKNAQAWMKSEKLSEDLEKEVDQRTEQYKLEKVKAEQEQIKASNALRELQETQMALSRAERSASMNSLVSHLAHEINNPLNYISTGEIITKESVQDAKSFILNAIPESPESKAFVEKINLLFEEIDSGIQQTSKGTTRIRDTIAEIRAITGIDGIHLENFDPIPILYQNLELTLEKNQISINQVEISIHDKVWPEKLDLKFRILSQKQIFSRAIRTLLNNNLIFALKAKEPKLKVRIEEISHPTQKMFLLLIKNNGPFIPKENVPTLFDLKSKKYFGTEIIGLPIIKELLKSIQSNISLTDTGKESGWVEFQILLTET
jgi:hypothetical protein